MKYTDLFEKAINLNSTSPDQGGAFDSPFWSMLIDEVCNHIREKSDIEAFLKANSDFVNFGLCNELHKQPDTIRDSIADTQIQNSPLVLFTFSQWLSGSILKIKQCDKKDLMIRDQRIQQIQLSKLQKEMDSLKEQRKAKLLRLTAGSSFPNPTQDFAKWLTEVEKADELQLESIRTKRLISRGVFFSVDQKREHANHENQLHKLLDNFRKFLDSSVEHEIATEIKNISLKIAELLNKIIDTEQIIEKLKTEIEAIEKVQSEVSPLELQHKVREEIEHIRDLTRLSAKRMHLENCPVLIPEKKYLTYKKIIECLDRIVEFDPKIFKNDRVNLFGKPAAVMVPGNGNAIYDWKNNLIIIPLLFSGDNPMSSIASGFIEYRLDTDEDKVMLDSYSHLPEMKNIRSSLQIKQQITKDYTTWMTSEYSGYRVLSKHVRDWFEHEIGPGKNEIFIPHTCQPFNFNKDEFKKKLHSIDEKIKVKTLENADCVDLWIGSVLFYIQGDFERAYDYLSALLKRDTTNRMALYNFGYIASKLYHKSEAIKGYTDFINTTNQNWWTRVASEHLRNLQGSGSKSEN